MFMPNQAEKTSFHSCLVNAPATVKRPEHQICPRFVLRIVYQAPIWGPKIVNELSPTWKFVPKLAFVFCLHRFWRFSPRLEPEKQSSSQVLDKFWINCFFLCFQKNLDRFLTTFPQTGARKTIVGTHFWQILGFGAGALATLVITIMSTLRSEKNKVGWKTRGRRKDTIKPLPKKQGGLGSVRFGYGSGVERFERFRFSVPAVPLQNGFFFVFSTV